MLSSWADWVVDGWMIIIGLQNVFFRQAISPMSYKCSEVETLHIGEVRWRLMTPVFKAVQFIWSKVQAIKSHEKHWDPTSWKAWSIANKFEYVIENNMKMTYLRHVGQCPKGEVRPRSCVKIHYCSNSRMGWRILTKSYTHILYHN